MEGKLMIGVEDRGSPELPSHQDLEREVPQPPADIFDNIKDVYNTRYILSTDLPSDPAEFKKRMETTIAYFRKEKVKGVYIEVSMEQCAIIGASKELGFSFHHAEGDFVTLQKWVPDSPSKLPYYATHYVGVGGLVIDWDAGKVLVIQERSGNDTFTWKVPGGLVDNGEYLSEAAEREVREETGILTTFKGVVAVREKKNYNFGRNDIYVVCLLEPNTKEINIDEVEIAKCKWVDVDDWAQHEFRVGIQEMICKLAQDMVHTYKAKKAESNHLAHVWRSTQVQVNLASFKGHHVAYIPGHMIKEEPKEPQESKNN